MAQLSFGNGYGWAGMSPDVLAEALQYASRRFVVLRKELNFDAIAFTGSSGCAIAFHLAVQHKIPLIYVRKPDEKSHGDRIECNSSVDIQRYLIVDDFVFSGDTITSIVITIQKLVPPQHRSPDEPYQSAPKCVGVLCFDHITLGHPRGTSTCKMIYVDDVGQAISVYS